MKKSITVIAAAALTLVCAAGCSRTEDLDRKFFGTTDKYYDYGNGAAIDNKNQFTMPALTTTTPAIVSPSGSDSSASDPTATTTPSITTTPDGTTAPDTTQGAPSGYYTAGQKVTTSFFDFTVNNSYTAYKVNGYIPDSDGYTHLCVNITATNTTSQSQPMGAYDYALFYTDEDYVFALEDEFVEGMYPQDATVAPGETITGDLYFIIPIGCTDVILDYTEYYSSEEVGESYDVYLTPKQESSAAVTGEDVNV